MGWDEPCELEELYHVCGIYPKHRGALQGERGPSLRAVWLLCAGECRGWGRWAAGREIN